MTEINKPGGKPPVPKSALILLAALVLGLIPLIVLTGWFLPSGNPQPEPVPIVLTPLQHHPDQEIVVSADRVTLYVPKEAIDLSGQFVIEPRQPNLFAYAGDPEWNRPIVADIQYRNADGVHFPGVTFAEPVSICFLLTPEQWADFTKRPDGYQVQYFDNTQDPYRWVAYPMATYAEEQQLCTQTGHLSIYALAVRQQEQIPITGPTIIPTSTPTATVTPVIVTPQERRNREPEATLPPPVNTRPPNPTKPPTDRPPTDAPAPTDEPLPTEGPSYPGPG